MKELDQFKQRLHVEPDSIIRHFAKRWERAHETDKARIAVMGEFSSGKTSFLEYLFGMTTLGTRLTEATALPVLYTYGESAMYGKWHDKPMSIRLSTDNLSAQTMNVDLPYEYLEVSLPVEFLKQVEFWDTPGSNGTINFELPDGSMDALFWCLPYNEPLSKTQRERLSHFRIAPIFLVLTKSDLMDETEEEERESEKQDRLEEVFALDAAYTSRDEITLHELTSTKLFEWTNRQEVTERKKQRQIEERNRADEMLLYAIESLSKKKKDYVPLYEQASLLLRK